ncbi:RusA family crossover junction endodeoxyribonuclease, partial [Singulisphaera rosea]
ESAGIAPYAGPVYVRLIACRACPKNRTPGERWDARPDADNLFKGCGDSISGNVFKKSGKDATGKKIRSANMPPMPTGRIIADDNQVTDVSIQKVYWSRSLVWIQVVAVDPHHPGPFPFAK